MKTVDILGSNRFENYTKTRDGSRAIIIHDGKRPDEAYRR